MNTSQKWWLGVCIFLSIIGVAFSVVALCNSCIRTNQIDYIGIVGSVLSATVTVLIGWQIYSLIRLEEYRKDYADIDKRILAVRQELEKRSLLLNAESSMLHGANYITWVQHGADISGVGTAYWLLCHALKNYAMCFEKESAGKCISMMKDCVIMTNDKNAWNDVFDKEVTDRVEQEYKVIHNLYLHLNEQDSLLLLRVRSSRQNKKLDSELSVSVQNVDSVTMNVTNDSYVKDEYKPSRKIKQKRKRKKR